MASVLQQRKRLRQRRAMSGGLLSSLTLAKPALAAEAQTAPKPKPEHRDFSGFIGVGRYSQTQREAPGVVPVPVPVPVPVHVRSKATADSPLLVTGARYAFDAERLLALDARTTFASSSTTERWTATAATVGGTTLTSNLLQTNRFSVQQNNTRLLFQQRLSGP